MTRAHERDMLTASLLLTLTFSPPSLADYAERPGVVHLLDSEAPPLVAGPLARDASIASLMSQVAEARARIKELEPLGQRSRLGFGLIIGGTAVPLAAALLYGLVWGLGGAFFGLLSGDGGNFGTGFVRGFDVLFSATDPYVLVPLAVAGVVCVAAVVVGLALVLSVMHTAPHLKNQTREQRLLLRDLNRRLDAATRPTSRLPPGAPVPVTPISWTVAF